MSFLDKREWRDHWLAVPVTSSVRRAAGCVQCGSGLETGDLINDNLSGKCFNCASVRGEDDEDFDELEG